jgi:hypothetical protein
MSRGGPLGEHLGRWIGWGLRSQGPWAGVRNDRLGFYPRRRGRGTIAVFPPPGPQERRDAHRWNAVRAVDHQRSDPLRRRPARRTGGRPPLLGEPSEAPRMIRDRPPRAPTSGECLWGKRFAVLAAILGIAGVIVGGSASAAFFLAAIGFLVLFGYCFRYTTYGGGYGGNP